MTDVPVQKFRDVAAMPRPPRAPNGTLEERIGALWERTAELLSPRVIRGVQRFRSIEEANAARDLATIERMRATRT
jgi:hypothetical protein